MFQFTAAQLILAGASAAAAWWARGRTGFLELSEDEADAAFRALCETAEAIPGGISPATLAAIAGKKIAPGMTWPPRPLASRMHKNVWNMLLRWAKQTAELAQAKGQTICEYLRPAIGLSTALAPTFTPFVGIITEATKKTGAGGTGPTALGGGPNTAEIANVPTPGKWSYQLANSGYGLLQHVGFAYNIPSGAVRMSVAKMVNSHPDNKAHATYREPVGNFEKNNYPIAVLEFDSVQPIYYPPTFEVGL